MNRGDGTHEHDERDEIVEVYELFDSEEEARADLAAHGGSHIHQMAGRWAVVRYLPLECYAGGAEREERARQPRER